jgi:hypothetical protein
MKGITHIALATALGLAVTASSGFAADRSPTSILGNEGRASSVEDPTTVWVVNNHVGPVKVYAYSEARKPYLLGRVGHAGFQVFDVPEQVLEDGATVQIKVYPDGVYSSPDPTLLNETAIKSRRLPADRGLEIQVWVQPELTQSLIAIERGM